METQSPPSPVIEPAEPSRSPLFGVAASVLTILAVVAFLVLVRPARDVTVEELSVPTAPVTTEPVTTEPVTTEPATTEPVTTEPATTVPATTVPPDEAPDDHWQAIWPAPGSGTQFDEPEEAVRDFATAFLGLTEPIVGELREGDSRSGEVDVRPIADGPVTTVLVRRLGRDESWSVLAAGTANIELSSPRPHERVSSPLEVTGRARAFEGTVQVEVREDGEAGPIGAGFVTGGGNEMLAFEGRIPFETSATPFGTVVLFTTSAEDGQVWEAVAVRVRLTSTDADATRCGPYLPPRREPGDDETELKVYFNCDGRGIPAPIAVYRIGPASEDALRASLEALLAGPTEEERAAGIGSWFGPSTAGMLRSVDVEEGHATVDLGDLPAVIPNASSSAGSAILLSQLDATVFQFTSIESVEYRSEGSCEEFTEWLQIGGCEPRTRPAAED